MHDRLQKKTRKPEPTREALKAELKVLRRGHLATSWASIVNNLGMCQ
jgi:hypothetical protein